MTVAELTERTTFGSMFDDELCHVLLDDFRNYCGAPNTSPEHGTYRGEAICPVCGRPTCPRCAALYELDMAAESS